MPVRTMRPKVINRRFTSNSSEFAEGRMKKEE
jgi:hypothetical protein